MPQSIDHPSNSTQSAQPQRLQPGRSLTHRPVAKGKFLHLGENKIWVQGVTYGTFKPNGMGQPYPYPRVVEQDFATMAACGINSVRTYTVPPRWMLDLASRHGLLVMVGLPWEQHVTFLDEKPRTRLIEERVRDGVRACAGHPAVLAYAIGNEIPAPIVRWYGRRPIERWLERLYVAVKEEDSHGLVTYVNYPTTEYLQLPFLDLVCFNVYLETQERLQAYLARLHNLTGDRPLLLAEIGLDSRRHGEVKQAAVLDWQVRSAFAQGCAGAFLFAWTDEWHRGGCDIEDWDFGLTARDRRPKPALAVVQKALQETPVAPALSQPKISVIVCCYNEARVIRDCLEGLRKVQYPNFEVIVIDDGSTDCTASIAREYGVRVISTANRGLSSARNRGIDAATGEIVAFIDGDAYPDPHWLTYLAVAFTRTHHAGVGGPNVAPDGDGWIAECVANAPGNPTHVLLTDEVAEHIPGCNMAYRKACLQAVGGFDPQFRAAGDDVDICWRLQDKGWTLGFHPSATVWHHRRNSVRAYWRQQKGYGYAESLLEKKWPGKYNMAGHYVWAGRLYATGLTQQLRWRRARIYHGTWGNALFQSIYHPAPSRLLSLALMPEWHLIVLMTAGLSALGLLWTPLLGLLPLLAVALGIPIAQACLSAAKAFPVATTGPRTRRWKLRALTAFLHLVQPLARLTGRVRGGLTPWRRRLRSRLILPFAQTIPLWSEQWKAPTDRLESLETTVRAGGAWLRRGADFDRWDLQVRGGSFGGARLRMTVEEHGAGKQMVRFNLWPVSTTFGTFLIVLFSALGILTMLNQAWTASATIGLLALAVSLCVGRDCAAALGFLGESIGKAGISDQPVSQGSCPGIVDDRAAPAQIGAQPTTSFPVTTQVSNVSDPR